jgi:hemerythrin superfamily protein
MITVTTEPEDASSIGDHLGKDHRAMEALLQGAIDAVEAGDQARAKAEWLRFTRTLVSHFDVEEALLIPSLFPTSPREAGSFLQEHRHLRLRLAEIDGVVREKTVKAGTLKGFLDELIAHSRHEEGALYAWADDHLPEVDRTAIRKAIKKKRGRSPPSKQS